MQLEKNIGPLIAVAIKSIIHIAVIWSHDNYCYYPRIDK